MSSRTRFFTNANPVSQCLQDRSIESQLPATLELTGEVCDLPDLNLVNDFLHVRHRLGKLLRFVALRRSLHTALED